MVHGKFVVIEAWLSDIVGMNITGRTVKRELVKRPQLSYKPRHGSGTISLNANVNPFKGGDTKPLVYARQGRPLPGAETIES